MKLKSYTHVSYDYPFLRKSVKFDSSFMLSGGYTGPTETKMKLDQQLSV
jgi:hypothetical protein